MGWRRDRSRHGLHSRIRGDQRGGLLPPPANIICSVASAGASVASTALSGQDSEQPDEESEQNKPDGFSIGGDTLWEVLDSYTAAIDRLATEIRETEELVASRLTDLRDALIDETPVVALTINNVDETVSWREGYFEPRRPDLASKDEDSITDAIGYPD